MDTKKRIATLKELVQADIDAVHVYNRALEHIPDHVLHSQLTAFRDHHMKHLEVLAREIKHLGDEAPKFSKDLKGHLLETVTAFFTTTGMKGALTALKKMEEQTNETYGSVVSLNFSPELKETLRSFFSDEKTHLDYINDNLKVL